VKRALALALTLAGAHGCAKPSAPAPSATASVAPGPATPRAKAPAPIVPIQVTSQRSGSKYITFTARKKNRTAYVLLADSESGRYFGQNSGASTFVNPHVTFFGADGKRMVAVAPAGTVAEKDKTVLMSGGVHARTQDGMTLTSDTLRYDDESQKAHGEGHVVVTSPQGETLQGETLDWNLRDGRIDVAGAH
jgi:LPS export ABC transporter protein LptC